MKKKTKILLVDDEPTVRECLQYFLEEKFIVFTAASAEEALPMIKEHTPDVMLLDINLPQMNGISLLKIIRQFNKTIKVIIVSGVYVDFQNDPQLKALDIRGFLHKPISIVELEDAIKKALS